MEVTPTSIICCAGGGLQAAFIAGALSQVVHLFPELSASTPHIFATSASTASVFYYLSYAGNHNGEQIWTHYIPTSSFFTSTSNLRTGQPVYDVDHLVDIVFKLQNPLDIAAIRATPQHFVFPILNLQTRETELFSNKPEQARTMFPHHTIRNWLEYDIYELIRAALAIPILYDRPIRLGNHTYCDAGLLEPFLIPHTLPPYTRALYLMVRQKTNIGDIKIQLAAILWRVRAALGKSGLPGWIYTRLMVKPLSLPIVCYRLKRRIPNLTIISSNSPLSSLLQNTPASALHNWQTGTRHIDIRHAEIAAHFQSSTLPHPIEPPTL